MLICILPVIRRASTFPSFQSQASARSVYTKQGKLFTPSSKNNSTAIPCLLEPSRHFLFWLLPELDEEASSITPLVERDFINVCGGAKICAEESDKAH